MTGKPLWDYEPGPIELFLDKCIDWAYFTVGSERLTNFLGWVQMILPKGW